MLILSNKAKFPWKAQARASFCGTALSTPLSSLFLTMAKLVVHFHKKAWGAWSPAFWRYHFYAARYYDGTEMLRIGRSIARPGRWASELVALKRCNMMAAYVCIACILVLASETAFTLLNKGCILVRRGPTAELLVSNSLDANSITPLPWMKILASLLLSSRQHPRLRMTPDVLKQLLLRLDHHHLVKQA